MAKEVYCRLCKLSCLECEFAPYHSIRFHGKGSRIICDTRLCKHDYRVIKSMGHTPYEPQKLRYVMVSNPEVLNKDNNCKHFKRSILKTIWYYIVS